MQALRHKCNQSWTKDASSSRPPKRGGIYASYSNNIQRSQGIGSRGDPRLAVCHGLVQQSIVSNVKAQGQYDSNSGGHRGDHSRSIQPISCPSCGKNHPGQCRVGDKMCYLCGEPEHIKRFCPTLPQGDSSA